MRKPLAALAAAATVAGGLVFVQPAAAVVDTASVLSYSGTTFRIDATDTSTPGLLVKGTSNVVSGTLNLRCYYGAGATYRTVAPVATAGDGSFSVVASTSPLRDYACVLRAIPSSANSPLDPSGYPGLFISVGERSTNLYPSTTTSGGAAYDYFVAAPQRAGYFDYDSAGGCGIDDGYVRDPITLTRSPYLEYCNAYFDGDQAFTPSGGPAGSANQRTALVVDGKTALSASEAHNFLSPTAPTAESGLSYSVTLDPGNGNTVIAESEPLVRCVDPSYPPSTAKCSDAFPIGVRLDRVITQTNDGRVSAVRDSYVSTDGAAHSVDVEYENDYDSNAGYTFPTDLGAIRTHQAGDSLPAQPAGPGTAYVTYDPTIPANSLTNPVESMTWSTAPTGVIFEGGETFYISYTKFVPAGGVASLTQTYGHGVSIAEVQGYASTARSTSAPTLTITSPNGAPVGQRAVVVRGRFASGGNEVPSSVHAGIFSAPVASDGTFALPVTLAPTPGPQTLAVMGTDSGGLVASAAVTLVYTNPFSLGSPKGALTIKKTTTTHGRLKLTVSKVTGLSVKVPVSCAALGTPCRVSLVFKNGHSTVGSAVIVVPSGAKGTATVRLGSGALKAYLADKFPPSKHGKPQHPKRLTISLAATYIDPDGTQAFPATKKSIAF